MTGVGVAYVIHFVATFVILALILLAILEVWHRNQVARQRRADRRLYRNLIRIQRSERYTGRRP